MALKVSRERASQWLPESALAQRLADSLRNRRLSVLSGAAGAGKSALITVGLLPLLHRRAVDAAIAEPRVRPQRVLPFPERRSAARARLSELVVYCDEWTLDPLATVHGAIDASLRAAGVSIEDTVGAVLYPAGASLPERVQVLGNRYGTRLLFIFDSFEVFLKRLEHSSECKDMANSLVRLLNRRLPANVLIAMRADSQSLIEPITTRLFELDAEVLTLPHWRSPAVVSALSPVRKAATLPPEDPSDTASTPASLAHETTVPNEIYVDIANTLARTKTVDIPFEWAGSTDVAALVPGEATLLPGANAPQALPEEALASPSHTELALLPAQSARSSALTHWLGGVRAAQPLRLWALVFVIGVFAALVILRREKSPEIAARAAISSTSATHFGNPQAATPPAAPPAPLPQLELLVDMQDDSVAELPHELALAVASDRGVNLNVLNEVGTPQLLDAVDGPPHLAIVRYDALQEAQHLKNRPQLHVVAPLFTEELYFVVRADSPLRYIHQLEGRRIDAGPPNESRALTVREMYRQMFDKPLPNTAGAGLDVASSLEQLAAGHAPFDAVVFAASQPASAWARLAPNVRDSLKLLRLDPDNAASQRALRTYLPAQLAADSTDSPPATPTLASMAFLVFSGKPDAAQSDALHQFAQSLCRSLPALRLSGDRKWRGVQPGLQLDTGWPSAPETQGSWSNCGNTPPGSVSPSPGNGPTTPSTSLSHPLSGARP